MSWTWFAGDHAAADRHLHAGGARLRLRIDLHVVAEAEPNREPRVGLNPILDVRGHLVLPEAVQKRRLLSGVAIQTEVLRVERAAAAATNASSVGNTYAPFSARANALLRMLNAL